MKNQSLKPVLLNAHYSNDKIDCLFVKSWTKYFIVQYKGYYLTTLKGDICTTSVVNMATRFSTRHLAVSYLKDFCSSSFIKDCVIRSLVVAEFK